MTSYSTVQKQQLAQLGAYLQEKRQEQGKSIEDISLQTYIRAQLIKAVESGDTTDLPQPIFVQGFIRRYADALGLDGINFAKQFPVHSIPNTPRPTPRPAVQLNLGSAAQIPSDKDPQPSIGALPVIPPEKPPVAPTSPPPLRPVADANGVTPSTNGARNNDLTLDPTPLSNGELTSLGLDPLADDAAPSHGTSDAASNITSKSNPLAEQLMEPQPGSLFDQEAAATMPTPPKSAPMVQNSPMEPQPLTPIGSSLAKDPNPALTWLPWGIGAAAIIGAIALLTNIMGGNSDQKPAPQPAEAPQTEVAPAVVAPPVEPEPAPEPVAASSAPVSLGLEMAADGGESWMQITVDGAVAFEGILAPGDTELWEGQEQISINIGNASFALISINGNEAVPAGEPGGVALQTITPETGAE